MGRVTCEALIENLEDVWVARRGVEVDATIRSATIPDAFVDSGATLLSIPISIIRQLGLKPVSRKRVTSSAGPTETTLYDAVRLTVLGRSCTMDVIEVPDGGPCSSGRFPSNTSIS